MRLHLLCALALARRVVGEKLHAQIARHQAEIELLRAQLKEEVTHRRRLEESASNLKIGPCTMSSKPGSSRLASDCSRRLEAESRIQSDSSVLKIGDCVLEANAAWGLVLRTNCELIETLPAPPSQPPTPLPLLAEGASVDWAQINESASTATRWYTMNVSGVDYRHGEFLADGELVLLRRGVADFWMGAAGGNGAGSGQVGVFGGGGTYGGIWQMDSVVMEPGVYTVQVGDPDVDGGRTRIIGPFPGPTTGYTCGRYQYASGYGTIVGWSPTGSVQSAPPEHLYSQGSWATWHQKGNAGYGGSGSGYSGGAAGEVAGWTETPFAWGQGGGGSHSPMNRPDNSGSGGDGGVGSSFGKGGSGRFYIRIAKL
jgi:hypothetical protein